jgi:phosphocarrier protein HPr
VIKKQVKIVNKLGLHARAAAKLVTMASRFECNIHLARDHQEVNGKSIMGVMMLAASQGTEIIISANGPDENLALNELEQLVANRFEEDE